MATNSGSMKGLTDVALCASMLSCVHLRKRWFSLSTTSKSLLICQREFWDRRYRWDKISITATLSLRRDPLAVRAFSAQNKIKKAAHQPKWASYGGLYIWDITTVIGNETAGRMHAVTGHLVKVRSKATTARWTVGFKPVHHNHNCISCMPIK